MCYEILSVKTHPIRNQSERVDCFEDFCGNARVYWVKCGYEEISDGF